MKYQDFIKEILAGKFVPVYFFYGDEIYFIDEGVGKIESKFVSSSSANFNRDVFYGEEADAAQIVNTAFSIPMMATQRVVIVKNFQRLSQSGKELIVKYCNRPSPQTILVLIAENVDMRKKVYVALKKTAQVVECKSLYDAQVPVFIRQYVNDKGKDIRLSAIHLLQAKLGNSLNELINETDKLMSFVSDKQVIDVTDVEELVGISRNYNVFQLWDALGARNLSKSLLILRQMLETGERSVGIVTSLTTYFLRLWRIRSLKSQNVSNSEVGKKLRIHQFFLQASIKQAQQYSTKEIKKIMRLLLDADIHLKSSYQSQRVVLELLLLQIVTGKKSI